MTLDVTTLERFKEGRVYGGQSGAVEDSLLSNLITAVSANIERELDRFLTEESHTEIFDVRRNQARFFVRGYPINETTDAVQIFNDTLNQFPASSEIVRVNFTVNPDIGRIVVNQQLLSSGVDALKVVYIGGMGTDTVDFYTRFPDIEKVAWQEMAHWLQRRPNFGAVSQSGGSGNISHSAALDLLPDSKRLLAKHKFAGVY